MSGQNNNRAVPTNIWRDSDFSKCNVIAKLCFMGLITIADDDGVFPTNRDVLKDKTFTLTPEEIDLYLDALLDDLTTNNLIVHLDENRGQITNFDRFKGETYE